MNELLEGVWGPLAGIECRRAVRRFWVQAFRFLVGLGIGLIPLVLAWFIWLSRQYGIDYHPGPMFRGGLLLGVSALVTCAWLLAPAPLAGSFSGEQAQGTLMLLLCSRVSAREVVMGRLAPTLAAVGLVLVAALPWLAMLAHLCDLSWLNAAGLCVLPLAVAFGSAALSLAFSSSFSRAGGAVLTTYFFLVAGMIASSVAGDILPPPWNWVAGAGSPYAGLDAAIQRGHALGVWTSCGWWLGLGVTALGWTSARLRRVYLRHMAGPRRGRRARRRRPVGSWPVVWKELHVDRRHALGKFGWWMELLIVVVALGGTALYGGLWYAESRGADLNPVAEMVKGLEELLGHLRGFLPWALVVSLGIQAAVSVAGERQRNTWLPLLTTPLDGRQILAGKLLGSIWALRWLTLATLAVSGMLWLADWIETGDLLWGSVIVAPQLVFAVCLGIAVSLFSSTGAKAVVLWTVCWLSSWPLVYVAALMAIGFIISVCNEIERWSGTDMLRGLSNHFTTVDLFFVGWLGTAAVLYVIISAVLLFICHAGFDTLAGRVRQPRVARRRPSAETTANHAA